MNNHPNIRGLVAVNEKRAAERQKKFDQIRDYADKHPNGFTVKELAIDMRLTGYSARRYTEIMCEQGTLVMSDKKAGKSFIYILKDLLSDKQEKEIEENKQPEQTSEEIKAGKEFRDPRCVSTVVAGDVSWVSSRSGNGMFFRYLILIVYSYKATCANVFPEGHEAINMNDPNFIYIGDDPESGERLFVDLTNICQRRLSAFGERCTHIAPDRLEAVKNRMARLIKIDIHPVGDQGTVMKLQKSLKAAGEINKQLEIKNGALEETNKQLQIRYDELDSEHSKQTKDYERIKSLCSDPNLERDYKALLKEYKDLESANENVTAAANRLIDENAKLREALANSTEEIQKLKEQSRYASPEMDEKFTKLVTDCAVSESKYFLVKDFNTTLENIVFALIESKGGSNGEA